MGENQSLHSFQQTTMSSTHILFLQNIRSLRKNIDELQILIKSLKLQPSFLCLTERWLPDNHTIRLFKIDGYIESLTCKYQQKGDDVAIISKKGVVMELHKKNNKIQVLKAKNSGAVAIYITAVYMKPNVPVNNSLIALENHLSEIYLQPDDINILCGDVNIGHSRESSRKTNLQNSLICFGLQCLNSNKPTRGTENISSVIDVVYTSKKSQIEILETSSTDQ